MSMQQPLEMNDRLVLFTHFEYRFDSSANNTLLHGTLSSVVFTVSKTLKTLFESEVIHEFLKTYRRCVEITFVAATTAALCLNLTAGLPRLSTHSALSIKPKIITATVPVKVASFTKLSHAAVAHYIAKRFHVSFQTAKAITLQAYKSAKENGIKPAVVLAIAAVESRYRPDAVNLKSGARGLMQILPYWHQQAVHKVGGVKTLLEIKPNIEVGAEILATYLRRSHGRLSGALFIYCGNVGYPDYLRRVKTQLNRITYVISHAKAQLHDSALKTINRLAIPSAMPFVSAKS